MDATVWGCRHVERDEAKHVGGWGARLIYREFIDGQTGILWDRQSNWGDRASVNARVLPALDRAFIAIRDAIKSASYSDWSGGGEARCIVWRDGLVLVVASPQQSHGYLYMSAVLERPEAYRQTAVTGEVVLGSGTDWHAKRIGEVEDALRDALARWGKGVTTRERDAAKKRRDDFLAFWPRVPVTGPTKPLLVAEFAVPAHKRGEKRPSWLDGIFASQDEEVVGAGAPESPFIGADIEFDTPGLTWDGDATFAEVYAKGGHVIVRNFLHPDRRATWEVYDPAYVPMLRLAATEAGAKTRSSEGDIS